MKQPAEIAAKRVRRKRERYRGQYLVRRISLEFNDDFWEWSSRAAYIVELHYSRQTAEKAAAEYDIEEVMDGGELSWAKVHIAYYNDALMSFADRKVWEIFGYSRSSGRAEGFDLTEALRGAYMLGRKFSREEAEILLDRIDELGGSYFVERRRSSQSNLGRVRIVYPEGTPTEVLAEAIEGLPQDRVRALLAEGADTEVRDCEGNTLLLRAIRGGRTDVLSPLIAHGADVLALNRNRSNAVQIALTYHPRPESVIRKLLATKPGKDRFRRDGTLLIDALIQREYEAFQLLAELGVTLKKSDIKEKLIERLTRELDETATTYLKSAGLLQQGSEWSRLLELIEAAKEAQKMREMMKGTGLAHPHALDSEGRNALQATLMMPSMDVPDFQKALGWGLDVNHRDNHGRTPIHYVAKRITSYAASQLISRGADVNALDNDGNSVIDYLPEEQTVGRANFAIQLFEWGVPFRKDVAKDWFLIYIAAFQSDEWLDDVLADLDENERIEQIDAALMQVAMTRNFTAMRRLLERGADPCKPRPSGHTALQAALWRLELDELQVLAGYFRDMDSANRIIESAIKGAKEDKRLALSVMEQFAGWLAAREQ